jgi:hypothetical protein
MRLNAMALIHIMALLFGLLKSSDVELPKITIFISQKITMKITFIKES